MENVEVCRACGGKCCWQVPGECFPEDFDCSEELVYEALKSGNYCIDWWEGDPRDLDSEDPEYVEKGEYIRPAHRGMEGVIEDPTWDNKACHFLTDNGCTLKYENRPKGCRELVPSESGCFSKSGGKKGAALAWLPYSDMLWRVKARFDYKTVESCSFMSRLPLFGKAFFHR